MSYQTDVNATAVDLHIGSSISRDKEGNSVNNMVAGQGRKKFIICALGTFVAYFYYGILQEDMYVYFEECAT